MAIVMRSSAVALSILLLAQAPLWAAGGKGPLWEKRTENIAAEDEKFEPSLVPAVLGGAAGGVLGIELGIVGVGIAAGSTASWWLLGGVGAVIGTAAGSVAGDYFFNRPKSKPPEAPAAIGPSAAR